MINPQGENLQSRFNFARIVYVFIMATIGVYTFVVLFMNKGAEAAGNPEFPPHLYTFKYIVYGLSVLMFFVITYVRKSLLSAKNPPDNVGPGSHGARFFIVTIVTAALCEAVLIYGLVLFFLGKQIGDFYTLASVSLAYFLYFFPKYSQWEEWAKESTFGTKP